MEQEEVLYTDPSVSISTSRIVVSGTSYGLRNITSLRMISTRPKLAYGIALIVAGIIWAVGIIGSIGGFVGAIILGGGTVAIGVWLLRPMYHLIVVSSSGEAQVLSSPDPAYITKVVEAINNAIASHA